MPLTPAQGFWARALAAFAALVVATVFGCAWTWAPSPTPAGAPDTEFSSARARAHIEAIARAPHPMGSPEHARVQAYVMGQLRAAKLEVAVQEVTSERPGYRPPHLAVVQNVVARRRGTSPTKALLLMAHYDSREMTPGASDDGYGVAALLETARALSAGPPGESDVIFLFTDGEEEGLLGAHAFASHHPWAADVGAVLNFDARGNAGSSWMFQTGDDNGAMVSAFARAAPHPVGSSLMQSLYRRMPNDTDLSIWLPDTPSLNFANIGGLERYHAPTDTLANIDEGTLQHDGTYALSIARELGAHALPLPRTPDASYFNVGPFFVHYASSFDQPLALAAVLLVIAFLVLGARHGSVRPARAALALAAVLAIAVASAVVCALLGALAGVVMGTSARLTPAASPTMKGLYLAAFVAVSVAIGLGAQSRLLRSLRSGEIFAAANVVFVAFGLITASLLPGAACIFLWPVVVSTVLGVYLAHTGALDHDDPPAVAITIAASLPAVVIVAPLVPALVAAFGLHAAPAVGGLVACLVALAAPAVRLLVHPLVRFAPVAALGIGLVLYLAGLAFPAFGRDYPRPDTLVFAVDGDSGNTYWLSPDAHPDAWTSGAVTGTALFEKGHHFLIDDDVRFAQGEAVAEAKPEIVWLDDAPGSAGRKVRFRVVPPPGALLLAVRVDGVTRGTVAGLDTPLDGGALAFQFYAPPSAGVEVDATAATPQPVRVRVVSQRAGFPADAKPAMGPRPEGLMAKPGMMAPGTKLLESDMTIVARAAKSQ